VNWFVCFSSLVSHIFFVTVLCVMLRHIVWLLILWRVIGQVMKVCIFRHRAKRSSHSSHRKSLSDLRICEKGFSQRRRNAIETQIICHSYVAPFTQQVSSFKLTFILFLVNIVDSFHFETVQSKSNTLYFICYEKIEGATQSIIWVSTKRPREKERENKEPKIWKRL
jgi:hypothetical protein